MKFILWTKKVSPCTLVVNFYHPSSWSNIPVGTPGVVKSVVPIILIATLHSTYEGTTFPLLLGTVRLYAITMQLLNVEFVSKSRKHS